MFAGVAVRACCCACAGDGDGGWQPGARCIRMSRHAANKWSAAEGQGLALRAIFTRCEGWRREAVWQGVAAASQRARAPTRSNAILHGGCKAACFKSASGSLSNIYTRAFGRVTERLVVQGGGCGGSTGQMQQIDGYLGTEAPSLCCCCCCCCCCSCIFSMCTGCASFSRSSNARPLAKFLRLGADEQRPTRSSALLVMHLFDSKVAPLQLRNSWSTCAMCA